MWCTSLQVCPRPQKQYEAHIGLKSMEEQAVEVAEIPQRKAKLALEALASRVEARWHTCGARSPSRTVIAFLETPLG